MTVTTASREEYIGHALEAAIRSRIKDRAWYRRNRSPFPWSDFERDNDVALRDLFDIRREAIRQYRAERERVEAAYRQLRAMAALTVLVSGVVIAVLILKAAAA